MAVRLRTLKGLKLPPRGPRASEPGPPLGLTLPITLRLPWPPTVNHARRTRVQVPRYGKPYVQTYRSKEAKLFLEEAAATIGYVERPLIGRVKIDLLFLPPDRRRRDLDNLPKLIFDVLQQTGVVRDDVQFRPVTYDDGEPVRGGLVVIRLDQPEISPQRDLV